MTGPVVIVAHVAPRDATQVTSSPHPSSPSPFLLSLTDDTVDLPGPVNGHGLQLTGKEGRRRWGEGVGRTREGVSNGKSGGGGRKRERQRERSVRRGRLKVLSLDTKSVLCST